MAADKPPITDPIEAFGKQPRSFHGKPSHLRRLLTALREPEARSWNEWRRSHPRTRPDLRGVELRPRGRPGNIHLGGIDLTRARLSRAQLSGLNGWDARLDDADLRHANLDEVDLSYAHLNRAQLNRARLVRANLTLVKARRARLQDANLSHAVLNGADLRGADLRRAKVTGVSTWNVLVNADTRQDGLVLEELGDFLEDLVDTDDEGWKPLVLGRADQIEVVQLLNLIQDRRKFKTVIDALTETLVLLLGNFSARRMSVLQALKHKLATLGYTAVVFDFDPPLDRDLIETVAVLAGLSCFVIADLTRPRSTPLEAMLVVPQLGVPFATIIQGKERPFGMFRALQQKYPWVLKTRHYRDEAHLLRRLKTAIVDPCERMRGKLRKGRHPHRRRRAMGRR